MQGVELADDAQEDYRESLSKATMCSFVVHLWKEEAGSEEQQPVWRGHITSIPNGKRHYFLDIKDVSTFIIDELKTR